MINKVVLIGHLGKDPELKHLPSGSKYVRFSICTNESYKDKEGNWQDHSEWHNIVLWNDAAERANKQLKKGNLVYIEGKLTHRSWQDQDGNQKNMTEVAAQIYRKLEKKQGGSDITAPEEPVSAGVGFNTTNNSNTGNDDGDDDLPF